MDIYYIYQLKEEVIIMTKENKELLLGTPILDKMEHVLQNSKSEADLMQKTGINEHLAMKLTQAKKRGDSVLFTSMTLTNMELIASVYDKQFPDKAGISLTRKIKLLLKSTLTARELSEHMGITRQAIRRIQTNFQFIPQMQLRSAVAFDEAFRFYVYDIDFEATKVQEFNVSEEDAGTDTLISKLFESIVQFRVGKYLVVEPMDETLKRNVFRKILQITDGSHDDATFSLVDTELYPDMNVVDEFRVQQDYSGRVCHYKITDKRIIKPRSFGLDFVKNVL